MQKHRFMTLLLVAGTTAIAACGSSTKTTSGVTHIVVQNDQPVGGVAQIRVNKGDPVRFTVTSDVADEIHVHGYDFHEDVQKGGSASFDFPAKIDGVFVIELESRSEQIASLKVLP